MPPIKKPTKPAPDRLPDVLALFAKNLSEIERYHRRQPAGPELGQHVVQAVCASMVSTALTLALEGKAWDPPGA